MASTATPKIVPPGGGTQYLVLGDRLRCLIDGQTSGGTLAVFLEEREPGRGPPPHLHHREDELFHVLEGQYEFIIGGKTMVGAPGTTVFGPRGMPHAFRNVGTTRGRMLVTVTPAGLERFFAEVDQRIGAREPDMDVVLELFEKYGLELA